MNARVRTSIPPAPLMPITSDSGFIGAFSPAEFDRHLLGEGEGRNLDVPGLKVRAAPGHLAWDAHHLVICTGRAWFHDIPARRQARAQGDARGWLTLAARHRDRLLNHVGGDYALVLLDLRRGILTLATDRFATHRLSYRLRGGAIEFSDRSDALGGEITAQGVFDYFFNHVIATPATIWQDVMRLGGAERVRFSNKGLLRDRHWRPRFDPLYRHTTPELEQQFRDLLKAAVARQVEGRRTGCFLSGGTDSSTVAGMLSTLSGARVSTYSIGFDAKGYDEMDYAQLAAAHFDCTHHAHYLQADHLIQLIPALAAHSEQPFGNSSLAPAYLCALVARAHGTDKLLAGDGGDELFGGNSRYAEQKLFALWGATPAWLRHGLQRGVDALPVNALTRKASRMLRHASTPMPDRLERYNLLHHLGAGQVFEPAFLARVSLEAPLTRARETWQAIGDCALIDRMLAYDWQVTLADNDLPKVTQACSLAGVAVGFPLLDETLVDFSLQLAPALKVRGLALRYFFKHALRHFLPRKILRKSKHGFGLPFGPWLLSNEALMEFSREAAFALASRGVISQTCAGTITGEQLSKHPGYFGEMVWLVVMLEHWLRAHAPQWRA